MATRSITPVHLWIVGAVALLWNSFGAHDYFRTRMRDTDYLASMMPGVDPNATLAWIDGFPVWAHFGWGLGVWGGLLGTILLLVRSKWAVPVFAASLAGAAISLGYQMVAAPPLAGMEGPMAEIMPFVIILIALGLFLYARSMTAKGVLR